MFSLPQGRPCAKQQEPVEDCRDGRRRLRERRRHCVAYRIAFLRDYSTIRRALGDHLDGVFGEQKRRQCNPLLNSDTEKKNIF
jgi:hypothetical protein